MLSLLRELIFGAAMGVQQSADVFDTRYIALLLLRHQIAHHLRAHLAIWRRATQRCGRDDLLSAISSSPGASVSNALAEEEQFMHLQEQQQQAHQEQVMNLQQRLRESEAALIRSQTDMKRLLINIV